MTVTRLRQILKNEYKLKARKLPDGCGTRYAILEGNGNPLFSLDVRKLKDDQHARERIQQEFDFIAKAMKREGEK